MGFKSVMKGIGRGLRWSAPVLVRGAGLAFPEYQRLIELGWSLTEEAERESTRGWVKGEMWARWMALRTPEVVREIEAAEGVELVDEGLLAEGMLDLREATVKIRKAFRKRGDR